MSGTKHFVFNAADANGQPMMMAVIPGWPHEYKACYRRPAPHYVGPSSRCISTKPKDDDPNRIGLSHSEAGQPITLPPSARGKEAPTMPVKSSAKN